MKSQSETTQTVSALILLVLKTGDYNLWSMRMEEYLTHTDYALWEVIVNGDAPAIASASVGTEGPIPPKIAEQKLARKNELKCEIGYSMMHYLRGGMLFVPQSVGFHTTQQMVISLPCLIDNKELTSPEQTAPALASPKQMAIGKDFSNPLIVDSLLKTICSSLHHVFTMKHWLVQSKRLLHSFFHNRSYPTRLLTLLVMENWEFCDKHNMVAFLEKSTGSEGFHQVIDFLTRSHICYALTKKPDVYVSFLKQFWRSAEATTDDNGEVKIIATIDGHSMTITEASLR
ncbi:hypothetical protein Tco_1028790 [Tanacetum coccineum]|uniref:DUF4219 domain-containing protein n=1 Tax=Tanacetum coccineum TaxID=301880 RepID=A0ABQ5G1L9_9ASTR